MKPIALLLPLLLSLTTGCDSSKPSPRVVNEAKFVAYDLIDGVGSSQDG